MGKGGRERARTAFLTAYTAKVGSWEKMRHLPGGWLEGFTQPAPGDVLPVFQYPILTILHIHPKTFPPRPSHPLGAQDRVKQRPPGRSPKKSPPSVTRQERGCCAEAVARPGP